MRRREFIGLIGGAVTSALVAQAEQRVRRIGLPMTMAETEPEAQARLTSHPLGTQKLVKPVRYDEVIE
jgi:hypothetical protein